MNSKPPNDGVASAMITFVIVTLMTSVGALSLGVVEKPSTALIGGVFCGAIAGGCVMAGSKP